VWEKFEHNALWVRDDARGTDHVYNYGMFDFDQPGYWGRFVQGYWRYWVDVTDIQRTVYVYQHLLNRSVTVQELNLTPAQRLATPLEEKESYRWVVALRQARAAHPAGKQPDWNRVFLYVWPPVDVPIAELDAVIRALAPTTDGLGLEQVLVQARLAGPDGTLHPVAVRMSRPPGQGLAPSSGPTFAQFCWSVSQDPRPGSRGSPLAPCRLHGGNSDDHYRPPALPHFSGRRS
jgi:hypothetical protein